MLTLEQYLSVANMWLIEKQGGSINPYDDAQSQYAQVSQGAAMSMTSMPQIGQDYTEEQLKRDSEESEYKFHPEDDPQEEDGTRSVKSQQVKSAKSLSIPHKVSKLGVKIKEIFFNKYHAKEIHRQQSHRDKLKFHQEAQGNERKASSHANYHMQVALEVERMQRILETECRNQRVVDIENRVRDNKRRIVNMLTENIFNLRFGFQENTQAV